MQEKLLPIRIPPGLYMNGTEYQARGRWTSGGLVRFFEGTVRPIAGWRRLQDSTGAEFATLSGCPRGAIAYRGDSAVPRLVVGTVEKLYIIEDATLFDITPSDLTTGSCQGSFSGGLGVYGAGDYGDGPYGGVSITSLLQDADTWTLDSFGDFFVGVLTSDGRLLVWEGDTGVDAVEASGAPANNRAVVVTPERFVFVLGAGGDPRKVQWPSQETTDDWTPLSTNTAGDFLLATTGVLMAGRRTRRQTLLFTDVDVHTATYIGGTLVYSFDQVGEQCGLLAPNAVAVVGSQAYWMGRNSFFRFDGRVVPLPCEVSDFVFSDFNYQNKAMVSAVTLAEFGEIWWFYPSGTAEENDRAVVYNYRENHWMVHQTIGRACGVDRGVMPAPIFVAGRDTNGVAGDGYLYEHEFGDVRDAASPSAPFLRSGPYELSGGERVMRVQRIVPDEETRGSLVVALGYSMFPTDTMQTTAEIDLDGDMPVPVRLTARMIRLSVGANSEDWRLGEFRLGVRPQGRR